MPDESNQNPADINGDMNPAATGLEIIAGYKVHPLATKFPLIVGKEFDDFVEAAARAGRLPPVETHNGLLIDGRNRLRVQEELARRGIDIVVPVIEWEPTGDETVAEHIWAVNAHRRHLIDDQRAALALEFLPTIRAQRQARQEASRFGQRGTDAAAEKSPPPDGQAGKPHRTGAEKDAASTLGGLAAMANVSMHKVRLANELSKAVDAGEVAASEFDAVVAGDKRLCDVVPRRKTGSRKKPRPQQHDEHDEHEVPMLDAGPIACEAEVHRRWEKQKAEFAIADHRELRRLFMKIIREEQQEFDE